MCTRAREVRRSNGGTKKEYRRRSPKRRETVSSTEKCSCDCANPRSKKNWTAGIARDEIGGEGNGRGEEMGGIEGDGRVECEVRISSR